MYAQHNYKYAFIIACTITLLYVMHDSKIPKKCDTRGFERRPNSYDLIQETYEQHTTLDHETCTPLDHIFFLKTHKCGSSTIQNILMRRGYKHGFNFVLPEKANYLGHPALFDPDEHIGKYLQLPSEFQMYHMFVHHTRYHADNIHSIMPYDLNKVTIVREPTALYESLYNYYDLGKLYQNMSLKTLLQLPLNDIKTITTNSPRFGFRVGSNQISFDLGFSRENFYSDNAVHSLIERIENSFDLVMLSEYMEASLVLLADIMCWPLEDVAYIPLNARADYSRDQLTTDEINKIAEINSADVQVYSHFKSAFKERVKQYGLQRMEDDMTKLMVINENIYKECIKSKSLPKDRNEYQIISYTTKLNAPDYCKYYTMHELEFTTLLRTQQLIRFDKIRKLQVLLHEK